MAANKGDGQLQVEGLGGRGEALAHKAMSMDQVTPPKPRALASLTSGSGGLTRQASLPAAPDSPSGRPRAALGKAKLPKQLIRMNSDSDLHIQPISSEEERVLETLDEIDLLHNIAKTPNLLGSNASLGHHLKPPAGPGAGAGGGGGGGDGDKRKLVKQKSLNRTLSTSVLRIKKKRSTFWNT